MDEKGSYASEQRVDSLSGHVLGDYSGRCWSCGKTCVRGEGKGEGENGGEMGSNQQHRLLRCSRCGKAEYCDRICQRKHWKSEHKASCKSRKEEDYGSTKAKIRGQGECESLLNGKSESESSAPEWALALIKEGNLSSLLGCNRGHSKIKKFVDCLGNFAFETRGQGRETGSGKQNKEGHEHEAEKKIETKWDAGKFVSGKEVRGAYFENYKCLGLSLCFEENRLDAIHMYNEGFDEYEQYKGALPYHLDWQDVNANVVRKFGEPSDKGGGRIPVWISYDNKGLQVDFKSIDWNDVNNPMTCITIFDPKSQNEDVIED
eukprot:Nk52_evm1s291 gene=Nk52_evmTU1s291